MKEKLKQMIVEMLKETQETTGEVFEISDETVILGDGGVMDSFTFVSFVADLEEKIFDTFGKEIIIVSEKAFSKKHSPFKNIDAIAEYAVELLAETQ